MQHLVTGRNRRPAVGRISDPAIDATVTDIVQVSRPANPTRRCIIVRDSEHLFNLKLNSQQQQQKKMSTTVILC